MKKGYFIVVLLCLLVPLSFGETVIIRAIFPIDLGGDLSAFNDQTSVGFGIGAEAFFPLGAYFQLGAGVNAQFDRSLSNYPDSKFNFDLFYVAAKGVLPLKDFSLYAIGRLGYDLFNVNANYTGPQATLSGGVCYSIGAGLDVVVPIIKGWNISAFVEGNYAVNNGELSYPNSSYSERYSRFQLAFGIAVGI